MVKVLRFYLVISLIYILFYNVSFSEILKIDLNLATVEDLKKIPGIGSVLAQRIVDYRKKHGPFHSLEELLNIKGIGIKKFQILKKYLKIKSSNNSLSSTNSTSKTSIYYYIDENGIYHFTHFPELVPEKYQKGLKKFK